MWFDLFPLVCLTVGWAVILVEFVKQEQPRPKYIPQKRGKLAEWDRSIASYFSLKAKMAILFILTVVVVIVLLLYPNAGLW